MNPCYRGASALLSGGFAVFSAVLFAIEAMGLRPRLRLLVRTGALAGALWMVALLGAAAPTRDEMRRPILAQYPSRGSANDFGL